MRYSSPSCASTDRTFSPGNFSFFRTFVTIPFEKKDPKAIEIIQVVLESIRELARSPPSRLY